MCQVVDGHPWHIGCDLSDEMADPFAHEQKLVAEKFLLIECCVQTGVYEYVLPEPGLTKIERCYRHCVSNPFRRGISLTAHRDAVHFALHYTAPGSSIINDMVLRTSPIVDERQEHVPGIRTRYLTADIPPDRAARISCTLGLPDGSGYVRLASANPKVQPSFNYRYLQHPNDIRRVREGLRLAAKLLESEAYSDANDYRIQPADDILANNDALDLWIRQTVGTARHVSGTCRMGPATDPMAVVDQYCRVKGIEGLWVADASVMPRIPRSGGAHATVIMIGERVVDWVAGA